MSNMSNVTLFYLSGFNGTITYRFALFSLTLLCYCAILMVNLSLIFTIILDQNLHEPMYIIVCLLCINGLYGTAGFYPKFISDVLSDIHVISYAGCLLQIYVIYSSAMVDYSILALMAYDRYVAICRPLVYHSVMSLQRTSVLVLLSWLVPLSAEVLMIFLTSRLTLCGSHIEKVYCENWSIVKLACGSTAANNMVGLFFIAFYFGHAVFIVCSYVQLVRSALKSTTSSRKFTQTCVPHLFCLVNVTTALLFDLMYARYGTTSVLQSVRNFMAIQFLVFPPLLNPVIYGLKLTNIRNRMTYLCVISGQKFNKLKLKF